MELAAGGTATVTAEVPRGTLALWEPEAPVLHYLETALESDTGQLMDTHRVRFGFKEFWIEGARFVLNGTPIRFRGDSWHYMGAPVQHPNYAREWFAFVRQTGANMVRLHGMPHPSFFLDAADELGVCIIDECAVYGSGGNLALESDEFWSHARDHVRRLALRDRNHPSVCLWSASNEVVWKGGPAVFPHLMSLEKAILEVDPTRPVSFDENKSDLGGGARIFGGHYGTCAEWQACWNGDKPLMVNEFGSLYYSGPEEPAKWGGEACFASFDGRLLACAEENRDMIAGLRALGASSLTPWNFVWYTLWPAFPSKTVTLTPDPAAPGIKTQQIGAHSLSLNYEISPGRRLEPDAPVTQPNAAYEPMRRLYAPVAAFMRDRSPGWFSRSTPGVRADVHNDSRTDADISLRLSSDPLDIVAETQVRVPAGQSVTVDLPVTVPEVPTLTAFSLTLATVVGGQIVAADTVRGVAGPEIRHKYGQSVSLIDDSGQTARTLRRMGYSIEHFSWPLTIGLPLPDRLVIGKDSLRDVTLRELVESLDAGGFFEDGGSLVVFEGALAPDRTSPLNPVEREFAKAWMRSNPPFWGDGPWEQGLARWSQSPDLPYANGCVAHRAFAKPVQGAFRPLAEVADGSAGLDFTPLLHLPLKNGGVMLNGFDVVTAARSHPAAADLLVRILEAPKADTAPLLPPGDPCRLVLDETLAGPWGEFTRNIGPDTAFAADNAHVVEVVDASSLVTAPPGAVEALRRRIEAGTTIILCGVTPDSLTAARQLAGLPLELVTEPVENLAKAPGEEASIVLDGLSHDDFVWVRRGQSEIIAEHTFAPCHDLHPLVVTTATRWAGYAEAAEQHKYALMLRRLHAFKGESAALAQAVVGQGRLLLCQMRLPESSTFQRKARRIWTLLLANLGVRFHDEASPLVMRISPYVDENGYLRRMLMLGVFGGVEPGTLLAHDFVGDEAGLVARPGQTTAGREWFVYDSPDPDVNLRAAFDGQVLNGVAVYAAIWVFSPTARDIILDTPDMVDLAVGCEDGCRIWLNGELIHALDTHRSFVADQDRIPGVKLTRGWNRLVMKFAQRGWEWRMSLRFLTTRGTPVTELHYALNPEEQPTHLTGTGRGGRT